MQSAALLLLGAFVLCAGAGAQDIHNYRLPTHIRPSNYKLEVTPYFETIGTKEQFTFDGIVEITLSTTEQNVSEIVLHSLGLTWTTISLEQIQPVNVIPLSIQSYNETTSKLALALTGALVPNYNYKLRFIYTGLLNNDMYGFYRSFYIENNQTKWAATTQMQPTHARRVFPCFDEPAFKATFDVIINRPLSYKPSISNTKLQTATTSGNFVREVFGTTPPMSTYLLAFIVSEFTVREDAAQTMGVIARPDAYSQTEYAFQVGPLLLEALNVWTDYNYSSVEGITKMHMAALPDFSAGAMENWGLLTYRETALLYDEQEVTALAQQRVAAVIAHEQAHMWFGDLVTCDWWSYTWLNEGFARFFQYFGTELQEPTWGLEEQFVVEQVQTALNYDSVESSRALTSEVSSPAEISSVFDSISYNKGGSVLRMIQHAMGKDRFQAAIRAYLREHQFKTTTPAKLFEALQRQSPNVDIAVNYAPWTVQPGYPLVNVTRTGPTAFTVRQERFFLKQRPANETSQWHIPLTYASSAARNLFQSTATKFIVNEREQSFNANDLGDWAIFNVQQAGYYRVNYDVATWKNISAALKQSNHSSIHVLNRAQIVDDLLNLARAEYVNYELALDAVSYLEKETKYAPWLAAITNLNLVARRLTGDDLVEYKKFIVKLSQHAYETLTFGARSNDSRTDIYNRANILNYRCKFGEKACVDAAKAQFAQLGANNQYKVPVNVRSVVYCTAIAEGNQTVWDLFWNRYQTSNVASEKVLILTALGCTKNAAILTGYMDRIVGPAVRLQDKASAFAAVYNEQAENLPTVLGYVLRNHTDIAGSFGTTNNVANILSNLAARFTSRAQIDELVAFQSRNPIYAAHNGLKTAIQDAEFNLVWSAKNVPTIGKFLRQYNGAGALTSAIVLIVLSAVMALFH